VTPSSAAAAADRHDRQPSLHGGEDLLDTGDEPLLRQVLTNLVANALRHTPPDARITVRQARIPARGGSCMSGRPRCGPRPWWKCRHPAGWAEHAEQV
jgi:signal transduction histidine kinase